MATKTGNRQIDLGCSTTSIQLIQTGKMTTGEQLRGKNESSNTTHQAVISQFGSAGSLTRVTTTHQGLSNGFTLFYPDGSLSATDSISLWFISCSLGRWGHTGQLGHLYTDLKTT